MKKDKKKKTLKELGFKVKKKPSWSFLTLQDAASKIFNDRNQIQSHVRDDHQ